MRDLAEFLGMIFGAAVILMGVIASVLLGGSYVFDRPACASYGQLSAQQTYHSFSTGCLVKRGAEWVDYKVAVGYKQEVTIKSK